MPRRVRSSG
ncbi:ompA domain protein, partial [Vibrio parahaemolyticus V-223/04]